MTDTEASAKIPRSDAYQKLSKEKRTVAVNLRKMIRDEGVVGFFTDKIKQMANQIFKTDFETTSAKEEEIKKIKNEINNLVFSDFTPLQREIIRAIFHFTKLKVPVVRNPNSFINDSAMMVKYLNDGIEMIFTPSRETYDKAKIILEVLYKTPLSDAPSGEALGLASTLTIIRD